MRNLCRRSFIHGKEELERLRKLEIIWRMRAKICFVGLPTAAVVSVVDSVMESIRLSCDPFEGLWWKFGGGCWLFPLSWGAIISAAMRDDDPL